MNSRARAVVGEWREVALGGLVRNWDSRRVPLSSRERAARPGTYPYYGATGVMDYVNDFLFEGLHLLVAEDGSVETPDGKPFLQLVDGQCWVNNHAHVLQGSTEQETRYLYYALSTVPIRPFMSGSVQAKLSQANLNQIPVPYPREESQRRAIAHVLGTLDDKIKLNRRMNETLEAMARALFTSWFVDFAPVRAKIEGRWRQGESLPGLPAEHYDLFPDRLVDSELGEVPEGWEVRALGDCIELTRGLSYKGSGLASTGIAMHNLNSIYEGGGYKEDGIKYYNGNFQDRHVTQPGDVLVANTEQGHDRLLIGFAAIVPKHLGDEGLFSHHLYRIRPNRSSALPSDYVCQLLNTRFMHGIVSGYATGTTVNMLPGDALRIPSVVVPPMRLVATFSRIAEAARVRQYSLITECQNLAAERDALLPRLVSGKVRVGELDGCSD